MSSQDELLPEEDDTQEEDYDDQRERTFARAHLGIADAIGDTYTGHRAADFNMFALPFANLSVPLSEHQHTLGAPAPEWLRYRNFIAQECKRMSPTHAPHFDSRPMNSYALVRCDDGTFLNSQLSYLSLRNADELSEQLMWSYAQIPASAPIFPTDSDHTLHTYPFSRFVVEFDTQRKPGQESEFLGDLVVWAKSVAEYLRAHCTGVVGSTFVSVTPPTKKGSEKDPGDVTYGARVHMPDVLLTDAMRFEVLKMIQSVQQCPTIKLYVDSGNFSHSMRAPFTSKQPLERKRVYEPRLRIGEDGFVTVLHSLAEYICSGYKLLDLRIIPSQAQLARCIRWEMGEREDESEECPWARIRDASRATELRAFVHTSSPPPFSQLGETLFGCRRSLFVASRFMEKAWTTYTTALVRVRGQGDRTEWVTIQRRSDGEVCVYQDRVVREDTAELYAPSKCIPVWYDTERLVSSDIMYVGEGRLVSDWGANVRFRYDEAGTPCELVRMPGADEMQWDLRSMALAALEVDEERFEYGHIHGDDMSRGPNRQFTPFHDLRAEARDAMLPAAWGEMLFMSLTGACGAGKTHFLMSMLFEWARHTPVFRVLCIVPRICLAAQVKERFTRAQDDFPEDDKLDVVVYSDQGDRNAYLAMAGSMRCVYVSTFHSLHRVERFYKDFFGFRFDAVVTDEQETIVRDYASPLIRDVIAEEEWLHKCLSDARAFVVSDADFSAFSCWHMPLTQVSAALGGRLVRVLKVENDVFSSIVQQERELQLCSSEVDLVVQCADKLKENGARVGLYCASRNRLRPLVDMITTELFAYGIENVRVVDSTNAKHLGNYVHLACEGDPERTCLVFLLHGGMSYKFHILEMLTCMRELPEYARFLLAYTPVVNVGISIDAPLFDFVGGFVSRGLPIKANLQGLERIRNFSHGALFVNSRMENATKKKHHTGGEVHSNRNLASQLLLTQFSQTIARARVNDDTPALANTYGNLMTNVDRYANLFFSCLIARGYKLPVLPPIVQRSELKRMVSVAEITAVHQRGVIDTLELAEATGLPREIHGKCAASLLAFAHTLQAKQPLWAQILHVLHILHEGGREYASHELELVPVDERRAEAGVEQPCPVSTRVGFALHAIMRDLEFHLFEEYSLDQKVALPEEEDWAASEEAAAGVRTIEELRKNKLLRFDGRKITKRKGARLLMGYIEGVFWVQMTGKRAKKIPVYDQQKCDVLKLIGAYYHWHREAKCESEHPHDFEHIAQVEPWTDVSEIVDDVLYNEELCARVHEEIGGDYNDRIKRKADAEVLILNGDGLTVKQKKLAKKLLNHS
jgi:hypothetical protein